MARENTAMPNSIIIMIMIGTVITADTGTGVITIGIDRWNARPVFTGSAEFIPRVCIRSKNCARNEFPAP
jgi:hypothetical protein